MPGPAPKDPSQRRRANKPERGEWITLPDVGKQILPALPKRKYEPGDEAGEWHARTKAAWKAWQKDPSTTQYGPAEIAAAIELAWVFDASVRGGDKMANEVRLRMDGLGLTAKGKRDLRWRAPSESAAAEDGPLAPLAKLADVRRLKAV